MRVLLVSHRFPPDTVGGLELYTKALAAELTKRGDSVRIFARKPDNASEGPPLLRERLHDGSILHRAALGPFNPERFLKGYERLEWLFTSAVLESGADVVHINHLLGLSPRFITIAHRLRAAVIVSLHDFYFACPRVHLQRTNGDLCNGPDTGRACARNCFLGDSGATQSRWGLRSLYFRRALAMADSVVAYSDFVRSYFEDFVPKPIHLVANGVPDEWTELGSEVSSFRPVYESLTLAYCGTVMPHKGVKIIFDALRLARLPSVRVLVIGDAPSANYTETLRQSAASVPGLTVRFYGTYDRKQLPLLLQDADALVVPSLVPEAGPIVPREALALGIPVLAARVGALPELIEDARNGFTFDPRRPEDLASILRRLSQEPALLDTLREGARRSPVTTLSKHAERIQFLYAKAQAEFDRRPASRSSAEEFEFLHRALLEAGCGSIKHSAREQLLGAPELTQIVNVQGGSYAT